MRDMAFKLPSVFYVKMSEEEGGECILYNASRRFEMENKDKLNGMYRFTE